MASTVLAVATRAALDACAQLGLDRREIAERAGLDLRALEDPEVRIDAGLADAVWLRAAETARDPALALRAAEAIPDGAFRVIDYVAGVSATVGEGLRGIASYFRIVDPRGVLSVDEGAATVVLSFESATPGAPLPPPAQELTLAAIVLRSRRATGRAWSPERVSFAFPRPAHAAEHARLFGAEIAYDAPRAALSIRRADWDAPSARADAALASILDAHARDLVARLPAYVGLAAQVAEALERELRGGDPSIARIARVLGTSERTLQRRLAEERTSFAELADRARERWACAYLQRADVSLAEVAWLLGFADQSAFTRAFRRWTGQTPARYRASAQGTAR